jgi:uncharacterized integral membrane protein
MKKVKIVFWLLVLGFMGLVFFQNQDYFLAKNSLRIDLWFQKYLIPETPNGLYFLAFFIIGLLIAYVYYLPERFRCNKSIRQLNAKIASLEAAAATSKKATPPVDPHPYVEAEAPAEVSDEKEPAPSADTASAEAAPSGEKEPSDRS